MLLCSPHNPTGKVWQRAELDDVALQQRLIQQHKVAIMLGSTYGSASRSYLRLNAGCPRSKLDDGLDRLIAALQSF